MKVIEDEYAVLALVGLEPSRVSLNTEKSKIDCSYIFPDGYCNDEEEKDEEES